MNILIDGRPLVTTSAGITNFLKCSITAWAKIMPESKFYIALPQAIDQTSTDWEVEGNMHFIIEKKRIFHKLPNLIWLNTIVPLLVTKHHIDVYFSALPCIPFFLPNRIKKIIVVHDVVNIEYKETMQWTNKIANKLFFERSVKEADVIWTNSHYTEKKVNQYFPKRRCQKIFVGAATDKKYFKPLELSGIQKKQILEEFGIKKDFILFVGSLEPRKNLGFLLTLMPRLYKEYKLQLVVVGAKKWKNSQLKEIIESKDFPCESTIFCKFISNEKLAQLYSIAKCYVSTSFNEGFGMPQLEALLCGCPVVTANNSAMQEIAEGKTAAYTVEGYDEEKWIAQIVKIAKSDIHPIPAELKDYDWNLILENFVKRKIYQTTKS